jgi:hypothetical protein
MDIGFEKGQANFTEGIIDVCLRDLSLTPKAFER